MGYIYIQWLQICVWLRLIVFNFLLCEQPLFRKYNNMSFLKFVTICLCFPDSVSLINEKRQKVPRQNDQIKNKTNKFLFLYFFNDNLTHVPMFNIFFSLLFFAFNLIFFSIKSRRKQLTNVHLKARVTSEKKEDPTQPNRTERRASFTPFHYPPFVKYIHVFIHGVDLFSRPHGEDVWGRNPYGVTWN